MFVKDNRDFGGKTGERYFMGLLKWSATTEIQQITGEKEKEKGRNKI